MLYLNSKKIDYNNFLSRSSKNLNNIKLIKSCNEPNLNENYVYDSVMGNNGETIPIYKKSDNLLFSILDGAGGIELDKRP